MSGNSILSYCITLGSTTRRWYGSELDWMVRKGKGRHWMSNTEGKKGVVKYDSKVQH